MDETAAAAIRVHVGRAEQLFNTFDPSPFRERDLSREAEDFIVAWAEEAPRNVPLSIRIHLHDEPGECLPRERIAQAVNHYFEYLEEGARRDLRRLLQQGRTSFLVGAGFLAMCLLATKVLSDLWSGHVAAVVNEGLTIGGWVAMWRPIEIHLYGWWPLARKRRLYRRLANAEVSVEVRVPSPVG